VERWHQHSAHICGWEVLINLHWRGHFFRTLFFSFCPLLVVVGPPSICWECGGLTRGLPPSMCACGMPSCLSMSGIALRAWRKAVAWLPTASAANQQQRERLRDWVHM
jgi:hypothetical protein